MRNLDPGQRLSLENPVPPAYGASRALHAGPCPRAIRPPGVPRDLQKLGLPTEIASEFLPNSNVAAVEKGRRSFRGPSASLGKNGLAELAPRATSRSAGRRRHPARGRSPRLSRAASTRRYTARRRIAKLLGSPEEYATSLAGPTVAKSHSALNGGKRLLLAEDREQRGSGGDGDSCSAGGPIYDEAVRLQLGSSVANPLAAKNLGVVEGAPWLVHHFQEPR